MMQYRPGRNKSLLSSMSRKVLKILALFGIFPFSWLEIGRMGRPFAGRFYRFVQRFLKKIPEQVDRPLGRLYNITNSITGTEFLL